MSKMLWQPSEERIRQTNLYQFIEFVNERTGNRFADYADLYQWSITEIEAFWGAIWDHGQVIHSRGYDRVVDDLDKDGKMDLVCTTFEAWPVVQQTVQVFHNRNQETGHWIGVELGRAPDGCSPIGSIVKIQTVSSTIVRTYITGDSYRSQGAPIVHFGLGKETRVQSLNIRWACGETVEILEPGLDQWHRVGGF